VRAERLAALGRLAAALAHEIRNPLGGILGSVDLLRGTSSLSAEDRRLCEIVRRETLRLTELVGDMLDFARPRPTSLRAIDLAGLCREVVEAFLASMDPPLSLRAEVPERLVATVDPAQIRQVVWNLLRNAAQASGGGDDIFLKLSESVGQIQIEIADHGPGIPVEERDHVFEQFYSTRLQGTGLGLTLARQIVLAHGGRIEVAETPGGGATMRVQLPCDTSP
jgi:two-component system, NtrC family, sensor histidine kinase HydH